MIRATIIARRYKTSKRNAHPKMKKPYKPEPSPESTTEQAAEEAAPLKKHRLKRHLPTMTTLMMTALAGSIGKKAYRIHAA